jgi:adenylate kinase family enzyme
MSTSNIQKRFSQAYILGGSPCSGKSTIAEMLSAQYGFHYYKADDHESEHMQRAHSLQQPIMYRYSKLGWDAIWSQSAKKLCADELTYYCERFPFILEDLDQLASEKPLLLEGAAFLPGLLYEYPVKPENVIFMVPAFEFQVKYYSQRPFIHSILKDCHDPKQAFENWMKRDHLFGLEVIRQAKQYGYPVFVVDGSVTIPEQFEKIKAQFKL